MKKIEVDQVGSAINASVLKIPERRFPGILLQGDSLNNLNAIAERLLVALSEGRLEEAREEASEIHDLLMEYKRAYEDAMNQSGLDLPYPSTR